MGAVPPSALRPQRPRGSRTNSPRCVRRGSVLVSSPSLSLSRAARASPRAVAHLLPLTASPRLCASRVRVDCPPAPQTLSLGTPLCSDSNASTPSRLKSSVAGGPRGSQASLYAAGAHSATNAWYRAAGTGAGGSAAGAGGLQSSSSSMVSLHNVRLSSWGSLPSRSSSSPAHPPTDAAAADAATDVAAADAGTTASAAASATDVAAGEAA